MSYRFVCPLAPCEGCNRVICPRALENKKSAGCGKCVGGKAHDNSEYLFPCHHCSHPVCSDCCYKIWRDDLFSGLIVPETVMICRTCAGPGGKEFVSEAVHRPFWEIIQDLRSPRYSLEAQINGLRACMDAWRRATRQSKPHRKEFVMRSYHDKQREHRLDSTWGTRKEEAEKKENSACKRVRGVEEKGVSNSTKLPKRADPQITASRKRARDLEEGEISENSPLKSKRVKRDDLRITTWLK